MSSPLIGITCCVDRGKKLRPGRAYAYLAQAYINAVAGVGGVPVLVGAPSPTRELAARLDGLVISGGDDLPTTFGQEDRVEAQAGLAEDVERTGWSRELLDAMEAAAKPVLGVCYGMQLMNLHYGGTLLARLPGADGDRLDHGGGTNTSKHGLVFGSSPALEGMRPDIEVASCHRQAVDRVADGFTVSAFSTDNVVEAIECPGRRMLGVEWHPENDDSGLAIYGNFIRRCRGEG